MGKVENEVDYDMKPLTVADVQEQTRIYMERMNTNVVKIAGTVTAKRKSEPRPKIDKKTNEHLLNEDGSPAFWSPYYYVALAFHGGEIDVQVQDDWYADINVGDNVLFTGRKGLRFGSINDVYHNFTIL